MQDILQREINTGDLVVGMVISRNSDGMRFGVYNGSSVDFKYGSSGLITSAPSNLYLIANPTEREFEIKTEIMQRVTKRENEKKAEEETKKALKRIPKKDLVIGGYYRDDTGRTFFYLGHGTVNTCYDGYRYPTEESGFIYLRVGEHREIVVVHVEVSKSLRKIVAEEPNDFKVFKLDLNNLRFTEDNYWKGEKVYKITLDNK